MNPDFADQLDKFMKGALEKVKTGPFNNPFLEMDGNGRRFLRIAVQDDHTRAVFCFIERETGNIYYPACWKAPSLTHVRGNIFSDDAGVGCVDAYGPKRLR